MSIQVTPTVRLGIIIMAASTIVLCAKGCGSTSVVMVRVKGLPGGSWAIQTGQKHQSGEVHLSNVYFGKIREREVGPLDHPFDEAEIVDGDDVVIHLVVRDRHLPFVVILRSRTVGWHIYEFGSIGAGSETIFDVGSALRHYAVNDKYQVVVEGKHMTLGEVIKPIKLPRHPPIPSEMDGIKDEQEGKEW